MGSIQKTLASAVGVRDEAEIKESLQQLKDQVVANLNLFRKNLESQYTSDVLSKSEITGNRAFRYIEEYHISSSASISSDFVGTVNKSIDNIFGSGKAADIGQGIKTLVIDGLSQFIGSNVAGESSKKMFFVVPENNAIVRVDIFVWKYFFEAKNLVHNRDTAIAYVMAKSVVDHNSLIADELIYMVSDALNKGVYKLDENIEKKKCYEFFITNKNRHNDKTLNSEKDYGDFQFSLLLENKELSKYPNFKANNFNLDKNNKIFYNFLKNMNIISEVGNAPEEPVKPEISESPSAEETKALKDYNKALEDYKKALEEYEKNKLDNDTENFLKQFKIEYSGSKVFNLFKSDDAEEDNLILRTLLVEKTDKLESSLKNICNKLDDLNYYNKEQYDVTRAEKSTTPASLEQVNNYLDGLIRAIKKVDELKKVSIKTDN